MAPEIAKEKLNEDGKLTFPYTNTVDIWAMDKVLLTLLDGCKENSRYGGSKGYLNQDKFLAAVLISQMMSTEAKYGPTVLQCLDSSWLQQEESFSKKVAQKKKALPDLINH